MKFLLTLATTLALLLNLNDGVAHELGDCPRLAHESLTGEYVDVQQMKGQLVIVEYWATWCAPCVTNLRHLKSLQAMYDGVAVVGINSESNAKKVLSFMAKWSLDVLTLWDRDQKLLKQADPSSLPYTIVLDQTGCVIWRGNGAGAETLKSLEAVVSRHAGGRL